MSTTRLRCYAAADSDGQWSAVCIDLSLAAQGESCDEALTKLRSHIVDYVNEAFGEDSDHEATPLNRKAPFSLRAKYHYIATRLLLSRCINLFKPSNAKVILVPASA